MPAHRTGSAQTRSFLMSSGDNAMAEKNLLITIDGPAGAGKSTVSRMLADRLECRYFDTGALYRAVAYESLKKGISAEDDPALETLCRSLRLELVRDGLKMRILSGGVDVSDRIRTADVTMQASAVSARPVVRAYLLTLQRELGLRYGGIFEGRDMGTVVFPEADLKFYLDASVRTRALRRQREFAQTESRSLEAVEKDIRQRDQQDSSRAIAPLKPASEAIIIDSTDLSPEDAVDKMLEIIGRKYAGVIRAEKQPINQ